MYNITNITSNQTMILSHHFNCWPISIWPSSSSKLSSSRHLHLPGPKSAGSMLPRWKLGRTWVISRACVWTTGDSWHNGWFRPFWGKTSCIGNVQIFARQKHPKSVLGDFYLKTLEALTCEPCKYGTKPPNNMFPNFGNVPGICNLFYVFFGYQSAVS